MARISYAAEGTVALIGLSRPEKRNAFDRPMLDELAQAYTRYEEDSALRCALVFAHGEHFTGGLDLAVVGPELAAGAPLFPAALVDPCNLGARRRTKPVVMAVRGSCLTIGIELGLAADIVLAGDDTRFSQIEVKRGILPFGGATLRFPAVAGWQNAMRWMLTGDFFDAKEAHRMGLVQEVVAAEEVIERARAIAETIALQAPLAVQATYASARSAVEQGSEAEIGRLPGRTLDIFATEDAAEGRLSLIDKRTGSFKGR